MECMECGSRDFDEMDGIMFCRICSTQSQSTQVQETDADILFALPTATKMKIRTASEPTAQAVNRKRQRRSSDELDNYVKPKFSYFSKAVAANLDQATPQKQYGEKVYNQEIYERMKRYINVAEYSTEPERGRFIERFSARLLSFSITIVRGVSVLLTEMKFPQAFETHCYHIWQRYLAYLKVAFCGDEEGPRKYMRIHLSIRHLMAIFYLAALRCGLHLVTLHDFVRWLREDRFFVPVEISVNYVREADPKAFPLSEFFRVFSLLCQLLNLPEQKLILPSLQMCSRFLNSLNLPNDLLAVVKHFMKKLDLTFVVSLKELQKQGSVYKGEFLDHLSLKGPFSNVNFDVCFGRIFGDVEELSMHLKMSRLNRDVFFAPETKALALIVLALKLTFGLDNQEEYKSKAGFRFSRWLWQLKMRIQFYRDYSLESLLSIGATFDQKLPLDHDFLYFYEYDLKSERERNRLSVRNNRQHFKGLQGNKTLKRDCEKPLLEKADGRIYGLGHLNIYAPLVGTIADSTMNLRELQRDSGDSINAEAAEVLFEDYTKVDILDAQDEDDSFLSSNYEIYPRPEFCSGVLSMGSNFRPNRHDFVLNLDDAIKAMTRAKCAFSRSFSDLLDSFALIIGEDPPVLYAAFLLLEIRLLDNQKLTALKKAIEMEDPISIGIVDHLGDNNYVDFHANAKSFNDVDKAGDFHFDKRLVATAKKTQNKQSHLRRVKNETISLKVHIEENGEVETNSSLSGEDSDADLPSLASSDGDERNKDANDADENPFRLKSHVVGQFEIFMSVRKCYQCSYTNGNVDTVWLLER
ncbi:unnamed protein product, partial [Mesorhabditis belari]|uniref:TATA box-binding protein-associated factor RNA polymerase I subunit B n=1 Tax=Mesorhabditis belari TaxID=2138241 RepID=A0AAF3J1S6_9BILA